MKRRAGCALLAALALATTTCSRHPRYPRAETVIDAGGESYWVAGSEGFAARIQGDVLVRYDYPRRRGVPSYTYESSGLPTANIVSTPKGTFLFTRHAEVRLLRGTVWEGVPVRFEESDIQIDNALLAPDGRLLLHSHWKGLLWTSEADLGASKFTAEALPAYMTGLRFVGNKLFAFGYAGADRTVERRDGPGVWRRLVTVPSAFYEPVGVARSQSDEIVVALSRGLFVIPEDGPGRAVPVDELLRRRSAPAAVAIDPSPSPEAPRPEQPDPASSAPKNPLQIAGGALPEPSASLEGLPFASSQLTHLFTTRNDGLLLVVVGRANGIVRITRKGPVFTECGAAREAVGVAPDDKVVRIVTRTAELWQLDGAGCRRVRDAAIRREELGASD